MKSTINELIAIVGKGDFYKVVIAADIFTIYVLMLLMLRVR